MAARNRAPVLPRVLAAFAELTSPRDGWRLVAVDNASTDDTADILRGFRDRLPLTVLTCAAPGMNAALNVAASAVEGDLVLKADDDILPHAGWLTAYREAADAHPDAGLFGGTITPEWERTPPAWLDDRAAPHSVLFAACDRAAGPCPLVDIYGPNWAVRADLLRGPTPFDPAFGPDHTRASYAMGGETAFFTSLDRAGVKGRFVPGASVRHLIRAEQMTERWAIARAYRYGRGSGLLVPPECARGPSLVAKLPAALLVRLAAYAVASVSARLLPPSRTRLAIRYRASYLAGVAYALRHA